MTGRASYLFENEDFGNRGRIDWLPEVRLRDAALHGQRHSVEPVIDRSYLDERLLATVDAAAKNLVPTLATRISRTLSSP